MLAPGSRPGARRGGWRPRCPAPLAGECRGLSRSCPAPRAARECADSASAAQQPAQCDSRTDGDQHRLDRVLADVVLEALLAGLQVLLAPDPHALELLRGREIARALRPAACRG